MIVGASGCGTARWASQKPTGDGSHRLASCGDVPPAASAHAVVRAHLSAPKRAATGSRVAVEIKLSSSRSTRVQAPAKVVLIVRDGWVVGAYEGALTAEKHVVELRPGTPVTVRRKVVLLGCPTQKVDLVHPNASRRPLPAGVYQLTVGVNQPGGTTVAAAPVTITVTTDR